MYINPSGSRVKPLLVLLRISVKYACAYLSVCVAYNSTNIISPKLLYWTLSTGEQSGEKLGQLVNRLKEKSVFLCNSRSEAQNKNHQKTKSNNRGVFLPVCLLQFLLAMQKKRKKKKAITKSDTQVTMFFGNQK